LFPGCTVEPCLHEKAIFIKESIIDYFRGKKINVSMALLDMKNLTGLEQSVLYATNRIPYGKLKSYKEIAEEIQHSRASRFVGNALAKNPFPVLIPCHRVVRSDGSYGKFGGGPDLKRKMIELEATNCLA
jgi:methylated-DNA-[protein]-cysteine S-methyltransferase